jgi:D-3-phosphoglycerate dehydrogenase
MKILVVGDSFVPVAVFKRGFEHLETEHEVTYVQLDESLPARTATESGKRIREYLGSPDEVAAHVGDSDILVVHGAPVTDEVLAAGRELKLICCARGGPVNVDVKAATARRLPVVNTPGKNAEAVADQTIAFMVMLARGFPRAQRFLADGGMLGESAYEGAPFLGHELGGHELGLVGYGNVGRRVSRRALAFGMTVSVYDPFIQIDEAAAVSQVPGLPDLLLSADFVSLHVRTTPGTENLFSAPEFARMKKGAYFINTARETLVDEAALDAALSSGHLAGAALDVVRPRTGHDPHPLLRHENVVITPHIGGATYETLLRGVTMVADEISRFTSGSPLGSVVNRAAVEV